MKNITEFKSLDTSSKNELEIRRALADSKFTAAQIILLRTNKKLRNYSNRWFNGLMGTRYLRIRAVDQEREQLRIKMKQSNNAEHVNINLVRAGTILYPDADFTCVHKNTPVRVIEDRDGELYFECAEQMHHLDGQRRGNKFIGLSLLPWP